MGQDIFCCNCGTTVGERYFENTIIKKGTEERKDIYCGTKCALGIKLLDEDITFDSLFWRGAYFTVYTRATNRRDTMRFETILYRSVNGVFEYIVADVYADSEKAKKGHRNWILKNTTPEEFYLYINNKSDIHGQLASDAV